MTKCGARKFENLWPK